MIMLNANKQKLWYALRIGEVPIYETDGNGDIVYYTDNEGNKIPIETGETEMGYSEPAPFFANISFNTSEIDNQPFGTDISNYDAIVVANKDEVPLDENCLLWYETEPEYTDTDETHVDPHSADFRVLGIVPSLNQVRYILGRLAK